MRDSGPDPMRRHEVSGYRGVRRGKTSNFYAGPSPRNTNVSPTLQDQHDEDGVEELEPGSEEEAPDRNDGSHISMIDEEVAKLQSTSLGEAALEGSRRGSTLRSQVSRTMVDDARRLNSGQTSLAEPGGRRYP
ncbi:hypothetical protein VTH06DRAFT_7015 [Thermothelomyces fergusii]